MTSARTALRKLPMPTDRPIAHSPSLNKSANVDLVLCAMQQLMYFIYQNRVVFRIQQSARALKPSMHRSKTSGVQRSNAKFIIFNARFIIKFVIFNAKFIILNAREPAVTPIVSKDQSRITNQMKTNEEKTRKRVKRK